MFKCSTDSLCIGHSHKNTVHCINRRCSVWEENVKRWQKMHQTERRRQFAIMWWCRQVTCCVHPINDSDITNIQIRTLTQCLGMYMKCRLMNTQVSHLKQCMSVFTNFHEWHSQVWEVFRLVTCPLWHMPSKSHSSKSKAATWPWSIRSSLVVSGYGLYIEAKWPGWEFPNHFDRPLLFWMNDCSCICSDSD